MATASVDISSSFFSSAATGFAPSPRSVQWLNAFASW